MRAKTHSESNIEVKTAMRISLDIQLKNDADGIQNMLTLSSIVEELLEDESILIHMPIHQGNYYPLPRDEPILLKFFVDTEMYALLVKFEDRVTRGDFMLVKVRRLGKIEPHQQRDCYRLPCSLPVTVERLWHSERARHPESEPSEGRMINFSDGGLFFATDENIEKGEKITLTFDIGGIETVEGKALRTERIEDGKYLFKVAVRFRNKDVAQKRRFYKYIVDKQLEERRRLTSGVNPLYSTGKKRADHK